MASVQPVLYSFWRSSCAWRIRIALNLKEIEYEVRTVELDKLGGKGDVGEFHKINPLGKIPALQIGMLKMRYYRSFIMQWVCYHVRFLSILLSDGHTFVESIAIMEYLDETRPHRPLLPKDPYKRCKVREISEIIVSGIQPLQNLGLLTHVGDEKKLDWAQHWITRGFNGIEQLLSVSAGKYCVGDDISMADCCLAPQVFNAQKLVTNR